MKYALLLASLLFFSPKLVADEIPKITVSGSATVQKPAEKASITIGVVTTGSETQKALKSNSEKMDSVLSNIKILGLDGKEIQTGRFTISPQYSPAPRNPPPDWHASIVGYEVRNTLTIETTKLNLVSKIIDTATQYGSNQIQNLSFTLIKEDEAKGEAISEAIKQAQHYAEVAAKGINAELGEVIEIGINPPYINVHSSKAGRLAMATADVPTPIVPAQVEVSATVSMTYAIQGQ